jgi:hypothetical protein
MKPGSVEWAAETCHRPVVGDFDFDRPNDSFDDETFSTGCDAGGLPTAGLLPVSMNVLDFEEDGVNSWRELVPPLGGEDGPSTEEAGLPPDKASRHSSLCCLVPPLGLEA